MGRREATPEMGRREASPEIGKWEAAPEMDFHDMDEKADILSPTDATAAAAGAAVTGSKREKSCTLSSRSAQTVAAPPADVERCATCATACLKSASACACGHRVKPVALWGGDCCWLHSGGLLLWVGDAC